MRKRQQALWRAIACCAALAVCGASLLIAAEPASISRTADAGSKKLSKAPVSLRTGAGEAISADQAAVRAEASRTNMDVRAVAAAGQAPASSGLRDVGDNDAVIYDFFSGNIVSGDNNAADDWVAEVPAPPNKAYVIDEISFGFIFIQNTSIDTWVRIRSWRNYNLTIASDPQCVDVPVHENLLGEVVINLGRPTATSCTTFDRARINIADNVFWDVFEDAPLPGASIVSNTSPIGSLPAGTGEFQAFITIEFGRDIGGGVFGDGPLDACGDNPSGLVIFGAAASTLLAGGGNTGFYFDGFEGTPNDLWECDEGPLGFGFARNGPSLKLSGSLGNDCNSNGVVDIIEILNATTPDVNGNQIPDECETADVGNPGACTPNAIPDVCDISCARTLPNGTSCATFSGCGQATDCNADNVIDSCQLTANDCNLNSIPDDCDIAANTSQDCQPNGKPDECDVDPADPDGDGVFYRNCDGDSTPDACQRFFSDCNLNDVDDYCDILNGEMNDNDANGVPDVCQAEGRTHMLDFEFVGSPGFQYDLGPVHFQPNPDFEFSFGNWSVFDVDLNFLANAGLADVVAGSVGPACGGTKKLRLLEVNSTGVAQDNYQVFSPHVFFSDPATEVVFGSLPLYQEMSMLVKLNQTGNLDGGADPTPDTTLDWDIYFGSIFGGPADDPNTVYVNDYRVVVTFNTDTDDPSLPTEIQLFDGTTVSTGVDWENFLNQPIELKVIIDLRNATGLSIEDAGQVWWNGAQIATFTPRQSDNGFLIMDKLYIDQFRNTPSAGFGGASIEIDCIELTRDRERLDCSLFLSEDCNADGICDSYQLAEGDRNGNGTLDICEGFCPDCNNNSIIDTVEIAEGSAPDTNANDVIDWCEKTTHATGFEAAEGWVLGPVHGQLGWRETDGGLSEITATAATGWPRQGAQYLVVKKNPDTNRTFDIIYAPRQDALGDADIEIWSWDWTYSAAANVAQHFQLAVELGDLCTDIRTNGINDGDGTGARTPAGSFDEAEWIDVANAGVAIFANVPNATAAEVTKTRVYGLQSANAVHEYLEVAGVTGMSTIHATFFQFDNWNAAGLKVMNQRGQYDILWGRNAQSQTTMIANQLTAYSSGGTRLIRLSETRRTREPRYPSSAQIGDGGDRQLVIRVAGREATTIGETVFDTLPPFGTAGTATFFFDDFRYATGKDCDADGVIDANFLATGAGASWDRNADGIPDNCQDCDDDCGNFPILVGAVACLDPNEAVGNDCNANGLQDSCDVAADRPFINKIDTAGCYSNDSFLPSNQCFEARAGGGSCDANTNSIPDECEGADCNGNGCLDTAEIAAGSSLDVDGNTIPDECQPDCNNNGNPDSPKTTPNTDLNVGNTGGDGSQDNWPYFGNPLQIGDGIPDECCVVCTGLPGGFPWTDQCQSVAPDGDLDRDGDVDAYDFKFVQRCASDEPANPANPFPHPRGTVVGSATGGVNWDRISCGCADLNGDGVVDGVDANLLQTVVTGPE